MAAKRARILGAIGVRAIPITDDFHRNLRFELQRLSELQVEVPVSLDRVSLERVKQQLEKLRGKIDLDLNLRNLGVNAEEARRQLKERLERIFNNLPSFIVDLDLQVTEPSIKHQRHRIQDFIDEFDGRDIKVDVNANTFVASRQIAFTARTRFVDFIVRVNQASLAKAAAALAALSGARLLGQYGNDLWEFFRDLDKNIPKLSIFATAIGAGLGAVTGMVTQIASFGAGLAHLSPLLLTLPGLLMGGVAAAGAFVVAWMDAGEQLAELEEPFKNLRRIMSDSYWEEARTPILNLVTNLMPQLEVALGGASRAMGGFTGAFAEAFENQLGGGRLEAIFGTMEEGFRVLQQGADGYAGTIVNLALIAGRYFPRLAGWLNRNATAFSNWMDAIATDGRLDAWMNRAIDSLYDLWFGFTAFGSVLQGIWRASEAAGATAMAGFRETMERWDEVVNSPRVQEGMTNWFRGGRAALDSLGIAIGDIFDGLIDKSREVEDVFVNSGKSLESLGGIIDGILSGGGFLDGLAGGFESLDRAFQNIEKVSPAISDFFGTAAQFAGDMAEAFSGPLAAAVETVFPLLGQVLEDVSPLIQALADGLQEILESEELADLLGTIADALSDFFDGTEDAVPDLVSGLTAALSAADSLIITMGDLLDYLDFDPDNDNGWETLAGVFSVIGWAIRNAAGSIEFLILNLQLVGSWFAYVWGTSQNNVIAAVAIIVLEVQRAAAIIELFWQTMMNGDWANFGTNVDQINQNFDTAIAETEQFRDQLNDDLYFQLQIDTIEATNWYKEFHDEVYGVDLFPSGYGEKEVQKVLAEMQAAIDTKPIVDKFSEGGMRAANEFKTQTMVGLSDLPARLLASGTNSATGMAAGVRSGAAGVRSAAAGLSDSASAGASDTYSRGYNVGAQMAEGMKAGIQAKTASIASAAAAAVYAATNAAKVAAETRSPSKLWERELGYQLAAGGAIGIERGARLMAQAAADSIPTPMFDPFGFAAGGFETGEGSGFGVNLSMAGANLQVVVDGTPLDGRMDERVAKATASAESGALAAVLGVR